MTCSWVVGVPVVLRRKLDLSYISINMGASNVQFHGTHGYQNYNSFRADFRRYLAMGRVAVDLVVALQFPSFLGMIVIVWCICVSTFDTYLGLYGGLAVCSAATNLPALEFLSMSNAIWACLPVTRSNLWCRVRLIILSCLSYVRRESRTPILNHLDTLWAELCWLCRPILFPDKCGLKPRSYPARARG